MLKNKLVFRLYKHLTQVKNKTKLKLRLMLR